MTYKTLDPCPAPPPPSHGTRILRKRIIDMLYVKSNYELLPLEEFFLDFEEEYNAQSIPSKDV